MSVRKLLITATCLYQGKKKIRGSKSTRQWGLFLVSMLKWALTLGHGVMKSPRVPQLMRSVIKSHTCMKSPLSKGHKENDSMRSTPLQVSERKSESERLLVCAFTVAHGGLEEKQLQKDNLKDIDWGYKNILQSMRTPKGPKHYLVVVRVKDSFLLIRNQRKKVICNDNTTAFGKEKLQIGVSTYQKDWDFRKLLCEWDGRGLVSQWETTGNIVTKAARQ